MSNAQRDEDCLTPIEENSTEDGHLDNPTLSESEDGGPVEEIDTNGIVVSFAGRTDVGLVREHNEDNLVIADLTKGKLFPRNEHCVAPIGERGNIFAVCDGMGGAAAGEVASQMGVDILFDFLREGELPEDRDVVARRLVAAVEQAGKRIYDTAQQDTTRRGMGTTVTATVLIDKVLFIAQIGDSRAYLLRLGEFRQITKDQSLVSQLIEAGHLTEKEAETFEHSNIILQALGTSESVQVDLSFAELRKGDRLIVCSDGLSGMVDNDLIKQTLVECENPNLCCKKLIAHANAAGGHDNITVVVVDFDGDLLAEPHPTDTFGYIEYPLLPEVQERPSHEIDSSEEITVATNRPPSKKRKDGEKSSIQQVSKKRRSHVWLFVGIVALIIAGLSLQLSDFKDFREITNIEVLKPDHEVQPAVDQMNQQEVNPVPPDRPVSIEKPQLVKVMVRSDVENADLRINGESKGPLSANEVRTIELLPGAYRFEALTDGSIAAVVVATVRPSTLPLEVSLTLPNGAADPFMEQKERRKPQERLRERKDSKSKSKTQTTQPPSSTEGRVSTASIPTIKSAVHRKKEEIDRRKTRSQPSEPSDRVKPEETTLEDKTTSSPLQPQKKSSEPKKGSEKERSEEGPPSVPSGSDTPIPDNPF